MENFQRKILIWSFVLFWIKFVWKKSTRFSFFKKKTWKSTNFLLCDTVSMNWSEKVFVFWTKIEKKTVKICNYQKVTNSDWFYRLSEDNFSWDLLNRSLTSKLKILQHDSRLKRKINQIQWELCANLVNVNSRRRKNEAKIWNQKRKLQTTNK